MFISFLFFFLVSGALSLGSGITLGELRRPYVVPEIQPRSAGARQVTNLQYYLSGLRISFPEAKKKLAIALNQYSGHMLMFNLLSCPHAAEGCESITKSYFGSLKQ